MAKKDRTGNRIARAKRKPFKIPELGYYLIVTDTKATERCYFEGLCNSVPENIRGRLVIKVIEAKKTDKLIDKCIEFVAKSPQYRIPWIVFDRDQVNNFDDIIVEAESKGINVGWSNPCFEMWMYAYFGSMPSIADSWKCCSEFAAVYKSKTGQQYEKSDKQIYTNICKTGDEEKAIRIAQSKFKQHVRDGVSKPSDMCPCTTVHRLVNEIKVEKIQQADEASWSVEIDIAGQLPK